MRHDHRRGKSKMQQYRTENANDVHQLGVSVSRHFYAGKDGLLKYQKKPFEVTLANYRDAPRQHLMLYSLRDHFSGLYYLELALTPDLPDLIGFLGRAWRPKPDLVLHGLPEMLMLPETVAKVFPDAAEVIERQGVRVIPATSGFQSGAISVVKDAKSYLGWVTGESIEKVLREQASFIYKVNAKRKGRSSKETKANLWLGHVPEIRLPSGDFGVSS